MDKILTVYGEAISEKIIERSRFITYSQHVESEDEAKAFISSVCARHPMATHVCYAFISDKTGALMRFSDNGEPQGTAGMPILEVIKNKKLFETAVAVVRYFGGIKLGAGGLVRAYSSSAAENLDAAHIKIRQICSELEIVVEYTEVTPLLKFFEENACNVLNSTYTDCVTYFVAVKKENEEEFSNALIDYMQGRALIEKKKEYYFSFDIE